MHAVSPAATQAIYYPNDSEPRLGNHSRGRSTINTFECDKWLWMRILKNKIPQHHIILKKGKPIQLFLSPQGMRCQVKIKIKQQYMLSFGYKDSNDWRYSSQLAESCCGTSTVGSQWVTAKLPFSKHASIDLFRFFFRVVPAEQFLLSQNILKQKLWRLSFCTLASTRLRVQKHTSFFLLTFTTT